MIMGPRDVGHPIWPLAILSDDAWWFQDGRNIGQCESPGNDVVNRMVARPSGLDFLALEPMCAEYSHFLIADAGMFDAIGDPKTETGDDSQFIVAEMQTERRNWESFQP